MLTEAAHKGIGTLYTVVTISIINTLHPKQITPMCLHESLFTLIKTVSQKAMQTSLLWHLHWFTS